MDKVMRHLCTIAALVGVAIFLLVFSILVDSLVVPETRNGAGLLKNLGIFAARWDVALASISATVGLTFLLTLKKAIPRIALFFIHFVAFGLTAGFLLIQERMPIGADMGVIVDGLGMMWFMAADTAAAFHWRILCAIVAGGAAAGILDLIGTSLRKRFRIPFHWLVFVMLYLAGVIFFLQSSHSADLVRSPVYIRVPLLLSSWLIHENQIYRGTRKPPENIPLDASVESPPHIIFIMDESIGGKYLSLNGYARPTTPFLEASGTDVINYGICSSSANLSRSSNIIFIAGLRPDQIPDTAQLSMRQASIFAYANKAGRKSYFVDAQSASRYNLILPRDFVDFTMLDMSVRPYYKRDMKAADTVAALIESARQPLFIYVLKAGAHFSYGNKYPHDADFSDLDEPGEIPVGYTKAVRWTVDCFFEKLAGHLAGKNALVIYTSDHGQNFGPGGGVHANSGIAPPDQANVPLLVWPFSENARRYFAQRGGFNEEQYNRASHFQLFPTLLALFGYDRNRVRGRFGSSLFDPASDEPRTFFAGLIIDEFGNHSAETTRNVFDSGGSLQQWKNSQE